MFCCPISAMLPQYLPSSCSLFDNCLHNTYLHGIIYMYKSVRECHFLTKFCMEFALDIQENRRNNFPTFVTFVKLSVSQNWSTSFIICTNYRMNTAVSSCFLYSFVYSLQWTNQNMPMVPVIPVKCVQIFYITFLFGLLVLVRILSLIIFICCNWILIFTLYIFPIFCITQIL